VTGPCEGGGGGGGGGGCEEKKNKAMFLKGGKLPDQSSEFLNKDSVPWGYLVNEKIRYYFWLKTGQ